MSPEQATGGKVDARSDIFSFGAMLYEMATGVRAFAGPSTADTLAAVIRAQPKSPSAIVPALPSDLEKVILRCLRKDPDRRFQHAVDTKVALQEIKEESESGSAMPAGGRGSRHWPWVAALVVLACVIAGGTVWRLRPDHESDAAAPRVVPLTTLAGSESQPTFSPDGSQIAFVWGGEKDDNQDIYLKIIGSSEVRRLTTDPARDVAPSWSPDGRQIAFVRLGPAEARIKLVSPLGGSETTLNDFPTSGPLGWSPDGRYLAAGRVPSPGSDEDTGIYLLPTQGGPPRPLTRAKTSARDSAPAFSPDGRQLAYVVVCC